MILFGLLVSISKAPVLAPTSIVLALKPPPVVAAIITWLAE